jgi:hypothetical protein
METASSIVSPENVTNTADSMATNAPLVGNIIKMVPEQQRKGFISTAMDTVSSLLKPVMNILASILPAPVKSFLGMGQDDAKAAPAPAPAEAAPTPAPTAAAHEVKPSPTPTVPSKPEKARG